MISIRFPALSESAFLRYLTFSALYVAQGIPFGLLWFGLPAWMAMNGVSLLAIAGFMINLFTIFQDIAVDGLAIDIVPENQQARANGLMWRSKTIIPLILRERPGEKIMPWSQGMISEVNNKLQACSFAGKGSRPRSSPFLWPFQI